MLIVRNCFITKPGSASKLAAIMKETAQAVGMKGYRILTDVVGDFNQVVLEYEAANLSEIEAQMREYQTNPIFREKMKGYTDLWISGRREILQLVGS